MKLLRRIGKILLYFLIGLVVLSLAIVIAIRIPSVQNWAVDKVAGMLSSTLQTEVAVEGAYINFFKTVNLEGIYVEDQHGDTLLYAQELKADIGIFNLFGSEIYLNSASLEGAVVDLHRMASDSVFNFQFIMDAFAPTTPKDTTAAPWTFGIGQLYLQDVRFDMRDEGEGRFDLQTNIGTWDVDVDKLDLEQFNVELGSMAVMQSDVSFRLLERDSVVVPAVPSDTAKLMFPGFGWTVTADKIRMENNRLAFHDDNATRLQNALDYSHLDLQDLHLSINDLRFADNGISLVLNKAAFRDANGFVLEDMKGDVELSPTGIKVDGFFLNTPQSSFENNTSITFSEFNDLTDFFNKARLETTFEESHLSVRDLLMIAPAVREVPNLRLPEDGILRMHGKLAMQNNSVQMDDLFFSLDESTVLRASGNISQLTTDPKYDLKIDQLSTSYNTLNQYTTGLGLPLALKNFGRFQLSGQLKGTLANLQANNLNLTTQSATRFAGDLSVKGLPDINKAIFDLDIRQLATRAQDLKGFSNKPLPPQIDSLGLVRFAGNFKGTLTKFSLNGAFETSPGNVETDLSVNFNQNYSYASYQGKLAMENFDLASLLGDTLGLGEVTLNLDLNGEGLTLDSINTAIQGTVGRFVYQDYEYNNLVVDGQVINGAFDGTMNIEDENLDFNLTGKFNLSDSIPVFDLTASIDTVNLKNLNLSPSPLAFSGDVTADIFGYNLNNLRGTASLTNFYITGSDESYFDPEIKLEAQQLGGGERSILLNARFMTARVEGHYNFQDLPDLVISFINDFFPIDELALPEDYELKPRSQMADQQFTFDFQFTDLASLADVFLPGFISVDSSAFLTGEFNSGNRVLAMQAAFPNLQYMDFKMDTLLFTASGDPKRLQTQLAARNLNMANTFYAPIFDFNTQLGDDSLRFSLAVLDDAEDAKLKLGGRSTKGTGFYRIIFDQQVVINNENWDVGDNNLIRFGRNSLFVSDLSIGRGGQSIAINTRGEAPANDFAPIELSFNNFKLGEISAILNNPTMQLTGGINGQVTVVAPKTNLHYKANVSVDTLHLNGQLLGDLLVEASQPAGSRIIEVLTRLSGENEMTASGTYSLADNQFDIKADLQRLGLVVADPVLNTFIRESTGYVSGNLTIRGTPDKPAVRGSITTHDVSTEIVLAGGRYRTDGGTITFEEQEIDLGQMVLYDASGQSATVSGNIRHDHFQRMRFDIRAQTDGLQVLNTTRDDNPLYYGKLFASADVQIQGTPEMPILNVAASTQDSTLLHVEPLTTQLAVVQEDYIIFANPNDYQPDSLKLLEQQLAANATGFDLTLILEVTPEAMLNIIIDPLTGDQLFCSGSGDFIVRITPAGDMNITGSYVIDEGTYTFSYEGLVQRDFEIRKGSSLIFSGDPLNARLDVTAVYKTRTSTYELISTQATDPATLDAARRRTDVEVLMNIEGSLSAPSITFDIRLPDNQGGLVDNLISRRLADLQDEPTEMNKQVFGLLLFNSFITSESGGSLAGVGENVALSSVSNLITSQLNRLADRYIKGVDITVGFESYQTGNQGNSNVTGLQLGLSKQLFNDRLTIMVGGDFNLENNQASSLQEGGYSTIAGDFVLEYLLTEQGNYLLKVFHESDYNILLDANTTKSGVGIVFRKSY